MIKLVGNAQQFCAELCVLVNGVITFDTSSSVVPSAFSALSSSLGKRSSNGPVTESKRKKTEEIKEKLEEEIPKHQIGMYKAIIISISNNFLLRCI